MPRLNGKLRPYEFFAVSRYRNFAIKDDCLGSSGLLQRRNRFVFRRKKSTGSNQAPKNEDAA
jgi:hypothetical protein